MGSSFHLAFFAINFERLCILSTGNRPLVSLYLGFDGPDLHQNLLAQRNKTSKMITLLTPHGLIGGKMEGSQQLTLVGQSS